MQADSPDTDMEMGMEEEQEPQSGGYGGTQPQASVNAARAPATEQNKKSPQLPRMEVGSLEDICCAAEGGKYGNVLAVLTESGGIAKNPAKNAGATNPTRPVITVPAPCTFDAIKNQITALGTEKNAHRERDTVAISETCFKGLDSNVQTQLLDECKKINLKCVLVSTRKMN